MGAYFRTKLHQIRTKTDAGYRGATQLYNTLSFKVDMFLGWEAKNF